MTFSKYWKIQTVTQEYSIQQNYLLQIRRDTFPEKQKLREFINTRSDLQEMLRGVLLPETKRHEYRKLWASL